MIQLNIQAFELKLINPFNITHGSRTVQPTLVVSLEKDGITGYGEATAVGYYGLQSDAMIQTFEQCKPQLEALPFHSPESFWEAAHAILDRHPFLLCALDVAVHDWHARKAGRPLYQHWGLKPDNLPLSSFTIGLDEVPVMVKKLKEKPWPVYKIKLGRTDDLDIIKTLRRHTDAVFRIDANTGWTASEAREFIPQLRELGVEMIEQPLKVEDLEGMKKLKESSPLPLIADESCQTEEDVEKCAPYFHGINIKLMKCGGLTPARRMIRMARSLGLQVMVGCMIESSVGISAIAHLLPLIDYADMDSPLLISNDPAEGVKWRDGKVVFSNHPGTGVTLKTA